MTTSRLTPATYHIEIHKGDAWNLDVTVSINGSPANLTSYTIAGVIHPKAGGSDVTLTITNTNLAVGQFRVSLAAATSATMAVAYHTWHLTLTPPGTPAQPRKYLAGRFIVSDCV